MPARNYIFLNNETYHIYNKTIDDKKIFTNKNTAQRFIELCRYYRSNAIQTRFSFYEKMNQKFKEPYENKIHDPDTFKINILAYCVMPNHFHLLIRQRTNGGVVRFMSDVINSITRYFNTLTLRKGPIFLTQFRSKHIYSNDQLQYISRYIHLNPLAANLTRSFEETSLYRFSSLREYVSQSSDICSNQFLLKEFKNDLNNFVNYLKEEIVLSEEDDFTSEV